MTKAGLRRKFPPLGDNGEAARLVIPLLDAASSCFCYLSREDECSTAPILCHCLKHGIPLAVPVCEGGGIMSARIITDFSFLRRGRYGILEPPVDAPVMKSPKIVIVPGLLFDREGHRLGHGGGYYDRWLAKEGPNGRIIGLCRPERLVERLPRDSWDARVDEVVIGGAICL